MPENGRRKRPKNRARDDPKLPLSGAGEQSEANDFFQKQGGVGEGQRQNAGRAGPVFSGRRERVKYNASRQTSK